MGTIFLTASRWFYGERPTAETGAGGLSARRTTGCAESVATRPNS